MPKQILLSLFAASLLGLITGCGTPASDSRIQRSDIEVAPQPVSDFLGTHAHAERGPEDKISGFRFSQIEEGSVFAKMGLRAGDLLTSVNGKELNSQEDAAELGRQLQSGEPLKLTLVRRGQIIHLKYNSK